ncbi:MAG: MgtC/SapB family protein [Bacteroidetes bacterium]|nr:MgtC/SapB family protein [Bacteroidota bacterium]
MLSSQEIILRLCLASVFGALVGFERVRKDGPAGLRTHMMVCVGAALAMMVSAFGFKDVLGTAHVELDPSRIAAQVVSGIGFLGAGTILFSKEGTIRGLTTAAGLWTVAAIGLATGGGMYFEAGIATALALTILWVLQPVERAYSRRFKHNTIKIVSTKDVSDGELLRDLFSRQELKVQSFSLERIADNDFVFTLKFDGLDTERLARIVSELKKDLAVKEVYWNA